MGRTGTMSKGRERPDRRADREKEGRSAKSKEERSARARGKGKTVSIANEGQWSLAPAFSSARDPFLPRQRPSPPPCAMSLARQSALPLAPLARPPPPPVCPRHRQLLRLPPRLPSPSDLVPRRSVRPEGPARGLSLSVPSTPPASLALSPAASPFPAPPPAGASPAGASLGARPVPFPTPSVLARATSAALFASFSHPKHRRNADARDLGDRDGAAPVRQARGSPAAPRQGPRRPFGAGAPQTPRPRSRARRSDQTEASSRAPTFDPPPCAQASFAHRLAARAIVESAPAEADPPSALDFDELTSLLKLVHTTDIVELELSSKRFNISMKKKEALTPRTPVVVQAQAPLAYAPPPPPPPPAPVAAAPAPAEAAPAPAAPAPAAAAPPPPAPVDGAFRIENPRAEREVERKSRELVVSREEMRFAVGARMRARGEGDRGPARATEKRGGGENGEPTTMRGDSGGTETDWGSRGVFGFLCVRVCFPNPCRCATWS